MSYFLGFLLLVSSVINIMLVWYVREYTRRIRVVYQDLEDFRDTVNSYSENLEKMTKMEVYHGEPIIEAMMENTFYLLEYQNNISSSLSQILGEDNKNG